MVHSPCCESKADGASTANQCTTISDSVSRDFVPVFAVADGTNLHQMVYLILDPLPVRYLTCESTPCFFLTRRMESDDQHVG